jgi:hypothetical protein
MIIIPSKIEKQESMSITLQEISDKFSNGEIIGFQTELEKFRLFKDQFGTLCYFRKGSSKRGYLLLEAHLKGFRKFIFKTEINDEDTSWKTINKFRSYAEKASFSNCFIEACLKLPKTKEQWQIEGNKSLYEYGVTTGTRNEGEVITINGLKKHFNINAIKNAIKTKTSYSMHRVDFRGYDTSVSIEIGDDGLMRGFLSLEYRNTGNGHYYNLINDDCFIYTDLD